METIRQSAIDPGDTSTGSSLNLRLGSIWLRDCLRSHYKCAFRTNTLPTLPYRVLDVGSPDGSQDPFLSVGIGRLGRYATLSYRWGEVNTFVTTSKNIDEYRRKVSPHVLPKTLQDAIHVTRELGIRFLWINGLCIVQDSALDWEQQSAMMSDIYRNSFITVSANIGEVAGTRCFVERNPLESRPCRLGVSRYSGTDLLDRLGPCPAVEDPLAKPVFACIIEPFRSRGPLGNRAWVLQERLLSPRTLEFTRHGLRWQCDSSEASEMRPLERPVGVSSYNWNPIVHKIEPGSEYGSWYSLIGTYNRKSIIYPTNKLPALAGLANRFRRG